MLRNGKYHYLHLDVFTDRPLTGNQLAVFLDAQGLDADVMQRIALEMAFSETTFVFPAEHPTTDYRVRIFTPRTEIPMAGGSSHGWHDFRARTCRSHYKSVGFHHARLGYRSHSRGLGMGRRSTGFVFTLQPGEEDDATVFSRMFAPGFGVPEDPATGAASGPLGAYLNEYGAVHPDAGAAHIRSEEHTSELQSLAYLVCRLLLEKKKVSSSRD